MAYVKAIRSAQHFIYIENQYFLGSSYNWPDYKTAGANHLIPMELTLKVCSKIRDGQRFAVYIVIPMWPEGVPNSAAVQEILFFQTQTMKMMYSLVADTLRDCGLSHHPTDYLNFYCLGNRETKPHGEPMPRNPPDYNSKQGMSQRNRRMMIYVHSKGMIVDDEYVISGSANINQRSMDGSRDTEIAMGGYQPHHTWGARQNRPRGQVFGYRMSLWAEHLGPLEPTFEEPESLDCVRRVNDLAERNWQQYTAPEVTDMAGHLIRYPLKIEINGSITNLPGHKTFPDVGGKIMGTNQENIPDDLTA
jgi:phospholipase D1/2